MKYRPFSKTGLAVSEMGFGAMALPGKSQAEATGIVRTALDLGCTFFDTADVYGNGESERLLGSALGKERARVVVASKLGNVLYGRETDQPCFAADLVPYAVEQSLSRLGTDYLDVIQLHMSNHKDDIGQMQREGTIEALELLKEEGKIRHYGASFAGAAHFKTASVLKDMGMKMFQCIYCILRTEAETDIFPIVEEHGMGLIVRGTLASGFLTGRKTLDQAFNSPDSPEHDYYHMIRRMMRTAEPLGDHAEQLAFLTRDVARTLAQAAFLYALRWKTPSTVIANLGSEKRVREVMTTSDCPPLTSDELDRIHALTGNTRGEEGSGGQR